MDQFVDQMGQTFSNIKKREEVSATVVLVKYQRNEMIFAFALQW